MNKIINQIKNDFFTAKFNELYQEKWKSKGKTQADFAEAIRNCFPNPHACKCTNHNVSKWLSGSFPEMYLEQIAQVLEVDLEVFIPQTRSEKYEYDSEYIKGITDDHAKYAKGIGLKGSFMKYVVQKPDFAESFPVYSPLWLKVSGLPCFEKWEISRLPLAECAPVERTTFQIEKDGKKITLSRADLEFLKEVQSKVYDYVDYLFYCRSKEMEEEEKKAQTLLPKRTIDENGVSIAYRPTGVVQHELQEIDRFRKYVIKIVDEEEK